MLRRVEITLLGVGDKTVLTLVYMAFQRTERARNSETRDHYLPRLQLAAADGDAGPDTWLQAPGEMSQKGAYLRPGIRSPGRTSPVS